MKYPIRYGLKTRVISIAEHVYPALQSHSLNYHSLTFESRWLSRPELVNSRTEPVFYRCKLSEDWDYCEENRGRIDGHRTTNTYECLIEVTISGLHQSHVATAICTWEERTTETGIVRSQPFTKWGWRWPADHKGDSIYPDFGVLNSKLITKLNTPTMEALDNV